jgi:hypothetical protein
MTQIRRTGLFHNLSEDKVQPGLGVKTGHALAVAAGRPRLCPGNNAITIMLNSISFYLLVLNQLA